MVRGRIVGHILSMIYHIILELYNQPLVIIHFLSELQKLSRLSCVLFMHHSIISNFSFIQVFHVGRFGGSGGWAGGCCPFTDMV